MNSATPVSSADRHSVHALNWSGSIPVVLSLAPTSVSSPTLPPPIHILINRQTYLHVGLESAVQRLYQYAPATLSFASGMVQKEPDAGSFSQQGEGDAQAVDTDEKQTPNVRISSRTNKQKPSSCYPICWFEDEDTNMALRWHIFAGTLWDMKPLRQPPHNNSNYNHQNPRDQLRSHLPWKIRLHFTAYPNAQILPFASGDGVLAQVQYYYKNSLKQALCLQHGTSKVAMNVTKDAHSRLWEAVATSNVSLYESVQADSSLRLSRDGSRSSFHSIPIRLYVVGNQYASASSLAPIQRSCPATRNLLPPSLKDAPDDTNSEEARDGVTATARLRTLGDCLHDWLPDLFTSLSDDNDQTAWVEPTDAVIGWKIQGLQLPLTIALTELWALLAHPDNFCYIVVLTK